MYLIDTSIWISYLKGEKNAGVDYLKDILAKRSAFGITSVIYQEILQGVYSEKDFNELKEYFETQEFYHPKDPILTYEFAASLYFRCRKKGLTIRSTIDCLIASIAIEHDLLLLHNDKNFEEIAKIIPELNLVKL